MKLLRTTAHIAAITLTAWFVDGQSTSAQDIIEMARTTGMIEDLPALRYALQQQQQEERQRRKQLTNEASPIWNTREDVLRYRAQQRRSLQRMVLRYRQQLADHSAGSIQLTMEERTLYAHQIDILTRRVEKLKQIPDDTQIEIMIEQNLQSNGRLGYI